VAGALTPALARGRRAWPAAGRWPSPRSAPSPPLLLTRRVALEGPFSYAMGGWAAPWGIELRFDEFSAAILFICVIMLLVLVYSGPYVRRAVPAARITWYYSLLLINLGGMIGFAVTGDLFNLFVFMDWSACPSYALVAVGGGRTAALAAFKYLLAGAVSSVLILFCIGVLYALTGSLNMADVALRLGVGSRRRRCCWRSPAWWRASWSRRACSRCMSGCPTRMPSRRARSTPSRPRWSSSSASSAC
jgi:multicomponent Na+:H+ antiporter subunit D